MAVGSPALEVLEPVLELLAWQGSVCGSRIMIMRRHRVLTVLELSNAVLYPTAFSTVCDLGPVLVCPGDARIRGSSRAYAEGTIFINRLRVLKRPQRQRHV
jgi:hypothetical protein